MATVPVTAYLSLGSNLGDRLGNLRRACRALEGGAIRLGAVSSVYETEPVEFVDQEWFYNCVVEVETTLAPLELLEQLQAIERRFGRRREQPKGPRTLDIDLLLYGETVLQAERLVVPHPRMHERRFVLEPLREIAPTLRFPNSQKTIEQLFQELPDGSQVRRIAAMLSPPLA